MKCAALLLCVVLSLDSASSGNLTLIRDSNIISLGENLLLFPKESNTAYVKHVPLKPLSLSAFTLCMRISVDPRVVDAEDRETILFAYRTRDFDELNVWQEKGQLSFYLRGEPGVFFPLKPLSTFRTNLCLTWESSSGLAAFWVDGRRSMLQEYRKNHRVRPGGVVILGQDPDSFVGNFDEKQSFVGEISDVNMWDFVLTEEQIRAFNEKGWSEPIPKVLRWSVMEGEVNGEVLVVPENNL
ncbi:C-reactive protein-like [Hoplias malabaricus]|uniref:C-reactive protein-like n=1 Tax=Hoplias malabaricus TaxID=27720 RepID=UPI003461F620